MAGTDVKRALSDPLRTAIPMRQLLGRECIGVLARVT